MSNYLICRLLSDKGLVVPRSIGYGDTEVRSFSLLFPNELALIKESSDSFGEEINLNIAPIITTIVNARNVHEADYLAEIKFQQVLDCQNAEVTLGEVLLFKSGFIKNIDTGNNSPRLKGNSIGRYPMFQIMDRLIPKINRTQYLFTVSDSELKLAILRSYHWLRKSKNEVDPHLKCLFLWFSIECLAKVEEEDITGKIMQALGFPLGRIGLCLPAEKIKSLKNHSEYDSIRRKLENQLTQIRELRNKTVHEGFRSWDIPIDTLKVYINILSIAAPRVQNFAMAGLENNIETLMDMWDYVPVIFEVKVNVNDFHGNVLYMLQNHLLLQDNDIIFNEI
jgi:hypothetical protein